MKSEQRSVRFDLREVFRLRPQLSALSFLICLPCIRRQGNFFVKVQCAVVFIIVPLGLRSIGDSFFYWGKISDGGVCFGYAEALSYFQMTGDLRVSAANFA